MRWLALLMVVAIVACGGGDDDSAQQAGDTDPTPTVVAAAGATPTKRNSDAAENLDVHIPLRPGSSGEVLSSNPDPFAVNDDQGTLRVTVDAILDPAESTSGIFQPEPGNKFWAMQVTLKAVGDNPVNTGVWLLYTTDGVRYDNLYLTGVGDDILYGGLDPGESLQGVIVFEIPEDAEIDYVQMNPSIYTTGNLIFDAE